MDKFCPYRIGGVPILNIITQLIIVFRHIALTMCQSCFKLLTNLIFLVTFNKAILSYFTDWEIEIPRD